MEVRWWPVDHSIPGAVGYAIHTSAGWVAYTGDIRFHGRQRAATQRFAEALADLHPIALICEGTHPELDMASPTVGEDEIITNALPVLHRYEGKLVIADFAPRNIERLLSFCELAQQTGRILLAQPKDIYLMRAMCLADPDSCPAPEALPTIAMYADPKAAPRPLGAGAARSLVCPAGDSPTWSQPSPACTCWHFHCGISMTWLIWKTPAVGCTCTPTARLTMTNKLLTWRGCATGSPGPG